MDDQPSNIGQLYTLAEAASLTGMSVDALRHRVKRRRLQSVRGNDGMIRVRLTEATTKASHTSQAGDDAASTLHSQLAESGQALDAMASHVASLRERLAMADTAAAQLQDRISRIEQERDAIRQDREDARVRAATAEGEARALREALAEARRPDWRRWLGLG